VQLSTVSRLQDLDTILLQSQFDDAILEQESSVDEELGIQMRGSGDRKVLLPFAINRILPLVANVNRTQDVLRFAAGEERCETELYDFEVKKPETMEERQAAVEAHRQRLVSECRTVRPFFSSGEEADLLDPTSKREIPILTDLLCGEPAYFSMPFVYRLRSTSVQPSKARRARRNKVLMSLCRRTFRLGERRTLHDLRELYKTYLERALFFQAAEKAVQTKSGEIESADITDIELRGGYELENAAVRIIDGSVYVCVYINRSYALWNKRDDYDYDPSFEFSFYGPCTIGCRIYIHHDEIEVDSPRVLADQYVHPHTGDDPGSNPTICMGMHGSSRDISNMDTEVYAAYVLSTARNILLHSGGDSNPYFMPGYDDKGCVRRISRSHLRRRKIPVTNISPQQAAKLGVESGLYL